MPFEYKTEKSLNTFFSFEDERTNGIDQHDLPAANEENGVDEEDDEQIRTSVEDILE